MLPSWLRQLFRSKFQGHGTVAPMHSLAVEALEDRTVMTTATWTGGGGLLAVPDYTWSNFQNWAGGYRPGDDGDNVPDDVLFPSIANGLAKPNATITIVNGFPVFSWSPNSIIDGDYRINDLRIEGDNYFINSLGVRTVTLDGRLLVNFAGPVGPVTGMSLIGPILTQAQPISNLRIVLNDNVTTNPGFGPANQFINSNTGELYISATLVDGFAPVTNNARPSGIIKNGTGTISLQGNNTYSGVTSVQSGTLIAASDGALGASSAQTLVSAGATVGVSGGTIGDSLQILGTGVGGRGALRGIADSFTTFQGFSGGGGTWSGGVSILGDATIGTDFGLSITTNGIGGTGNLTKVGFATLSLVVDSTYAGNTLITEGSVFIYTDNALSAGFQTVVSSEATLNLDGGLAVNETLVITGDGSNSNNDGFGRPAGALTLRPVNAGTPSTWLGSITLTAAGASIGALGGSTLTLAGALIAPAPAVLSKVERGRVRIERANSTYLGTTRIDNGTLEVANAAALGAGAITVNATTGAQPAIGTLQLEGSYTLTQGLTLNGSGDSNTGAIHVVAPVGSGALGSSSITLSGSVVLNSTTNLNVDPRSTLTVSGVISDVVLPQAAELNKLGGGTLVLSGTNTYTGQTVLRDGVTSIKSARALGTTAAGTSVNTGAVLSLDGAAGGLTVTGESLSIASSSGSSPSTIRAGAGTNAWVGPINFVDTTNQGAPLNVEAVGAATLELRGSLGGAATIHKVGTGTVSFTGATANTLTGTIFVDAGTLALGNTGGNATNGAVVVGDGTGAGTDRLLLLAANQLADNKSVTVNSTGLFNLNGFSDTIGGSPVALSIAGGRVQTGAGILSLNGDVSAFGAGSGTNLDGNIDGNVFLTSTRTFLFLPTPQVSIQSVVNSSQYGDAATFIVTMTPFGTEPTVEGQITFYDGDTRIGSVQTLQPLNGVGPQTTAAISVTTLSGGLHTIRAVYSGSNFYAPTSVTMAEQQAVRNTPVFTTLSSNNLTAEPNPNILTAPTPNQSVTFTYRVTAPAGSITPTGSVIFFDNGVQIGAAQTITPDGFAYMTTSFPVPTTAAGRFHTITATYSGDLFFSSNTVTLSAPTDPGSQYTRPVSQQVGYDPLVQLTTDNDAVSGVRNPTINFQVSGGNGLPTPAGTVQFFLDGASLNPPVAVDATGRTSFTLGITSVQVINATWAATTATITTAAGHRLETGDRVSITGLAPAGYNGTFVVTRISDTQFSYTLVANPGAFVPPTANGVTIVGASWAGGAATVTTQTGHGLNTGDTVTIAGVTPAGYNGTFVVTRINATQFTYTLAASPGTFVDGASRRVGVSVTTASWTSAGGGTATVTTSAAHNLNTGDTVVISGLNPDGYNGSFTVTRISATQFSYSLLRTTSPGAYVTGGTVLRTGAGIMTASWANGTVTVTTTGAHNLETGDAVTLRGITRPAYNGTYNIIRISDTQFSYTLVDDPGAFITNNPLPAANATISTMTWDANTGVVTVNTVGTHDFQSGDLVTINTNNTASAAGSPIPSASGGFQGTFVVTRVSATQFTYALQLNPGRFVSTAVPPNAQSQVSRTVIDASWSAANGGEASIQTSAPHGLKVGDIVTLTGLVPNGYNVNNATVTSVLTADTFTFALAGNPGAFVRPTATGPAPGLLASAITNATWVGGVATITTASGHGLTTGFTVTITGVNPAGYNGSYTVTVLNGNQFSFNLAANPGTFVAPTATGTISSQITTAAWANGTVTANTAGPHNYVTGQVVTITGASPAGYNGTYTITVTSATQFTYAVTNDPGPFFMGTSSGGATRSPYSVTNTFATASPAALAVGEHDIRAEFRSTDGVFTDARATLSVPEAGSNYIDNQESNTPVVYQLLSSRTAVQISTLGGDNPSIIDPASFTFRVNTNDVVNYQNGAPTHPGDTFHPTPTGTVTFRDGAGRFLGAVDIGMIDNLTGTPGEATITGITFPRSLFAAGTTTITATYSGDQYYSGSTISIVQGLLATNTPVKFSTNRSVAVIGETVEFTVDASTLGAGNVPAIGSGFVNLVATNTLTGAQSTTTFTLGNRGVRGVGVGSLTFATPGTYTVVANYVATTNVIGSASVTLNPNLTVVAPFDAVLSSSRVPAAPTGSDVTFTLRTTVATNAGTSLAGTVEFYDGINKIGATQTLSADGTASITLSTLTTGTHTISAILTPPNGSPYGVTRVFMDEVQVIGTPPQLDINTSSSTAVEGEAVTIRVTASGSQGIPTGRVDLYSNGSLLASGVLIRNGVATFTTTSLTSGRYTIDARYTGDVAYAPIISTMTQDLVVISPVQLQVRSSANANVNGSTINYPVLPNTTVTYTAELRTNSTAPNNPLPDATGSVTFNLLDSNNNVVATTGPIDLVTVVVIIDANTQLRTPTAVGTLTAPAGVGNYRVVAVYSGDEGFSPLNVAFDQPVVTTLPAAAPVPTVAVRLVPTLNVNGSIQGGATTGLISSASGTLVLNGSNSYGGSTLITGAGNTVVLGTNNALPDTTAVTVTAGTLNANGKTDTVGALTGTGTVQLPPGSTLTTGALNTSTDFVGTLTGSGTLNKVGTGSFTLAAIDGGYTGTTNVAAGTVFLASNLGASNATVQSGAILGGSGTVQNVTVAPGGRLSPGGTAANPNTVGALTGTGNLTFNPGASFEVNVNGTTPGAAVSGYDQYVLTGTAGVNLNGATLVFNLGYTAAVGDTYTLINLAGTGTVTGAFAGLPTTGSTFTLNNRVYAITYGATGVSVQLIANASTATIASSSNPSAPGDSVTFTVTITPASGADPTPAGTVQFFVNGLPVGGAVPVAQVGATNAASAAFTPPTLPNGPTVITAEFTPTASPYQPRTQAELTVTQLVSVPSTTTLTPQQGPIVFGANASFLAAVPQQSGLPIPTGSFTFTNAATGAVLGAAALDGTGRALFSTSTLPPGTLTILATYSGDNFYRSSAGTATQVVDRQARTVVGSDAGPITTVQVYDSRTGGLLQTLSPFDLYRGGVKVATGDVNGDGVADIVVSAGAGADGGHVKVYDGVTFNQIASFFTFLGYNGGVNVAVGDVDGDGFGDVVVGTAVANDHVKAFSGRQLIATGDPNASTILSFFAYSTSGGNTVGVTVGTGDVDGDGRADIITGSATFAGHVKAFSGVNAGLLGSYFAYGAGYLGGIYVAGGDLDGDGKAEIITGATNAPHVKALRLDGSERASFFAFLNGDGTVPGFGARVGAVDRNGDRLADILVGSGGGAPAVKVFSGLDPSLLIESFIADPAGQPPSASGVFVGGSGLK